MIVTMVDVLGDMACCATLKKILGGESTNRDVSSLNTAMREHGVGNAKEGLYRE